MPNEKSGNFADLDYSGMHQYSDGDPEHADDTETYGSFEIFQGIDYCETGDPDDPDYLDPNGWYYWSCFPGCLPDSDPIGPFATSADAYHDAQGY